MLEQLEVGQRDGKGKGSRMAVTLIEVGNFEQWSELKARRRQRLKLTRSSPSAASRREDTVTAARLCYEEWMRRGSPELKKTRERRG